MLYKYKKYSLVLLAIILLVACKSALYIPTIENVAKNSDIVELQKGRALYINKCSSCHALHLTQEFSKTDWPKKVNKMAPRAKITDEEKRMILAYLTKGE